MPGEASITFNVGSELAGKTLYYYLYNADKTYKIVQSVVVAADGSVTVKQDHCSNYILTNAELTSKPEIPTDDVPKMGDGMNYVLLTVLASLFLGMVVLMRKMFGRA